MRKNNELRVGGLYCSRINWVQGYDKQGNVVSVDEGDIALYLGVWNGRSPGSRYKGTQLMFLYGECVLYWQPPIEGDIPKRSMWWEWWNEV